MNYETFIVGFSIIFAFTGIGFLIYGLLNACKDLYDDSIDTAINELVENRKEPPLYNVTINDAT